MSPIPAVHNWTTNGELIRDVAELHLRPTDTILDLTYGRGGWWTHWTPTALVTNDLDPETDAQHHTDFREAARGWPAGTFDVVAYDPPYKLNGTPQLGDMDTRYGITEPVRWQDRMTILTEGLASALRLQPRVTLAKCQDQVCGGKIRWQTLELTLRAARHGYRLVDRFDMIGGGREQPDRGRRQRHARGRGSTLLVFGP